MASGGRSRSSRKPEMRRPLSKTTGWPPPRPRPELVCGATAASKSVSDPAPTAAISASFSCSTGGTSVSTAPRMRSAVTTISPGNSSEKPSVFSGAAVEPSVLAESCANAGMAVETSNNAPSERVFMGEGTFICCLLIGLLAVCAARER